MRKIEKIEVMDLIMGHSRIDIKHNKNRNAEKEAKKIVQFLRDTVSGELYHKVLLEMFNGELDEQSCFKLVIKRP